MKKILFLIIITINALGQSVTISPTNAQSLLHIKKGASGVGVFNTNANLHIESNVNNYISLLTPTAFESGVLFGNPTSTADGGIIYNAGNAKGLQFRTNNNVTRMTLDAFGNMGIGATNPFSKLDIQGSLYRSHFYYDPTEDTYIRGGKGASRVLLNDIAGLGNVGIGTNNPLAKLHLSQGNLRVDNLAGSGNVGLYADNLGTISAALPIAFSVKSNTALIPIATITTTTFPFNTENYDEGGFFNNATYEFNAPVNGIYHFDSAVTFGIVNSANNLAIYNLSFVVDGGTGDAENTQDLEVGGFKTLTLSKDYKLNAGQKVKISVYQSSGATLNLLGQADSYFTGHLVTRL